MSSTDREAGRDAALGTPALRRVVAVLSVTQIVSWGCLYYGFAALQSAIVADTGWSGVAVTGAFSVSQLVSGGVGIWVGRHLDRYGPRAVMTGAALVAVPGMALVAVAPTLAWFYAGWVVVGVAMAGALYPPAFAALTRWGGERRVGALTAVTLAGGLASTVFAPLATAVEQAAGWRAAYLVLLAIVVSVTLPLCWWGLDRPWRPHPHDPRDGTGGLADPAPVTRSRAFVVLTAANALTALAVFAVVVNLVPMLLEQGRSAWLASVVLGLGGVGQFLGRLGYARFAAATSVTARAVLVVGAVAGATAAFALASQAALVVALGMLLGLARGVYTLVQATAVTDRWGPRSYGRLNGVLTAPALVASAVAPFAGAALADLLGSYADAFLVLAGVAAVAAVLMLGATPVAVSGSRPGRAPAG